MTSRKVKRSITDEEIALIRAMLSREMEKTTIQAYFTHPDRPVNYGRISNIEAGTYGPSIVAAADAELDKFLEGWRAARDTAAQGIAAESVDFATLPPTDGARLMRLFEKDEAGQFVLRSGENSELECKLSFHSTGNDRLLRAVAAMANNRGGYILFGVADRTGELVGLKDEHFKGLDPSQLAMTFRSFMEPAPNFEIGWVELDTKILGAIYVHPASDGPVIATKDNQTYKAGVIYFRYPGESRPIAGSEFRQLLADRDRRARSEASDLAKRAIELGPDGALLNFRNGQLDGRAGSLFVSPDLLQKIQFIREGEFVQKDGAQALRIVGDVQIASGAPEVLIREKVVRQGITDQAVLANFLKQEPVHFPAEYILHSCHSNKRWLPIFFYLRLTNGPAEQLVELIGSDEGGTAAVRGRLIDRLTGRATAKTNPSPASRLIINGLADGKPINPQTMADIRKIAIALQGWTDQSVPIAKLLSILSELRTKAKELSGDVDRLTEIRRAASWLDELYFRQRS